jgi:hypothetical protein
MDQATGNEPVPLIAFINQWGIENKIINHFLVAKAANGYKRGYNNDNDRYR